MASLKLLTQMLQLQLPPHSHASSSSSSPHNHPLHRMPYLSLRSSHFPFQVSNSSFPLQFPSNAIEQANSQNTPTSSPSSLDHRITSTYDASSDSNVDGLPSFHNLPNVASRKKKRRPDIAAHTGRLESSPAVRRLNGALSSYLGSEPRRRERLLNPQDRLAAVESVMTAQNLLSALDGVRFKLDHADFNTILRRFGGLEKWKQAVLVFDWMKVNKKLIPATVTSFISMMGKAGLPEKALRAYKGLTDSNMRRNKFVCNALFKILIESEDVEKAFNLFDEIKVDGFIPDLYTYSTLISGCVRHQSAFRKAESLMEEMLDWGLKPDSFIYESLLDMCAHFGLEDEAVHLFEKMKADKVSPNVFHYSSMLDMYVERGKPDEAEKVFQQMKEAGFLLNQVAYCHMMDLYCKAQKLEEAHLLFEDMKEKRIDPGSRGYCILIRAYSKLGKVGKVEALTEEIESRDQGISDLVLFNTLLKSYCDLRMMDMIMKILKRMDERSMAPDLTTFNTLICYFCNEALFDLALCTLDDLKARELCADLDSYAPLVAGLAQSGKVGEAIKLFAEMKEAQITSSSFVFESLIVALCKEGRADEAFMYLKEMLEINMSPVPSGLENLLILMGSRIDLLQKIFEGNIMPLLDLEQVDFGVVFSAYREQGYEDAIPIFLDYIGEGCSGKSNE